MQEGNFLMHEIVPHISLMVLWHGHSDDSLDIK